MPNLTGKKLSIQTLTGFTKNNSLNSLVYQRFKALKAHLALHANVAAKKL